MLIQSESHGHYLTFTKTEKDHFYTLDGKIVPGVTTVNHAYPKAERLIEWQAGEAAKYAIEQLSLCPEQVSKLPKYLLDEIVKKSKQASKKKTKEAADIGSLVHSYCEQYPEPSPELVETILVHKDSEKIKLCTNEFIKWTEASKYETVDAEQSIASVQYRYAGTYDRLVKHGKKFILIDFKTSSGIYSTHKIQVGGAYRQALKEWRDLEIDGIDLVRFGKDGSFEHELITRKSWLDEFTEQFIRNLETSQFREKHESY